MTCTTPVPDSNRGREVEMLAALAFCVGLISGMLVMAVLFVSRSGAGVQDPTL